jgi:WRKY transcription factor 22
LSPRIVTAENSSQPFAKQVSPSTSGAEVENATSLSTKSNSKDLEDLMNDVENEFELSDMVVTDDFFEGLDELTGLNDIFKGLDELTGLDDF